MRPTAALCRVRPTDFYACPRLVSGTPGMGWVEWEGEGPTSCTAHTPARTVQLTHGPEPPLTNLPPRSEQIFFRALVVDVARQVHGARKQIVRRALPREKLQPGRC